MLKELLSHQRVQVALALVLLISISAFLYWSPSTGWEVREAAACPYQTSIVTCPYQE